MLRTPPDVTGDVAAARVAGMARWVVTVGRAAWTLVVGVILVVVAAGPASATPAAGDAGTVDRPVTLVLVRDLTWATAPPALDGFAKASLSMRNAAPRSGAEDTYLTLGKGNRSAALPGGAGVGRVVATSDGGLRLLDWPALADHDAGLHFGGPPGSVGEALRRSGLRWAVATDDGAAAAVAVDVMGSVPRAYPGTLDGGRLAVEARFDALVVVVPAARLTAVLEVLDGTCTIVASASTPADNRHLGVLAASRRCELGSAGLASGSTHHAHLLTLPDVTATFLDLVGVPPSTSIGGVSATTAAAVERVTLVERDRRAWTADRARAGFVALFVLFHALGAVGVLRIPTARRAVCATLLSIPPASFLMMSVPWGRFGFGAGVVAGGLMTAGIATAGVALMRRDVALGVGALAALTAVVIGVDALFASPLQIDAPFGNSPIGAGRFFGVGNIASGFLVAGLLVAGGVAIERWGRDAVRWVALATAAGTVAGGAPPFGADVGGVLFAVPAYGVLLLGAVRPRIRFRHLVLLAGAAVVAVALFAAVDLVGAAGSPTHLGKGLIGVGLMDEVIRKATLAVQTLIIPLAMLAVAGAAVLASSGLSLESRAGHRLATPALITAAVLGSLLNDSGALVAAAVLAVGWPAAVALGASAGHFQAASR